MESSAPTAATSTTPSSSSACLGNGVNVNNHEANSSSASLSAAAAAAAAAAASSPHHRMATAGWYDTSNSDTQSSAEAPFADAYFKGQNYFSRSQARFTYGLFGYGCGY